MGAVVFAAGAFVLALAVVAGLAARGWTRAAAMAVASLAVLALGLAIAGRQAEGMRALAYAAMMTVGGLPALLGAAIGGAAGWRWRRRRHGA